jgi:hypothetical protein
MPPTNVRDVIFGGLRSVPWGTGPGIRGFFLMPLWVVAWLSREVARKWQSPGVRGSVMAYSAKLRVIFAAVFHGHPRSSAWHEPAEKVGTNAMWLVYDFAS